MTPEARHIKITNGRARSYLKNKVDTAAHMEGNPYFPNLSLFATSNLQ